VDEFIVQIEMEAGDFPSAYFQVTDMKDFWAHPFTIPALVGRSDLGMDLCYRDCFALPALPTAGRLPARAGSQRGIPRH